MGYGAGDTFVVLFPAMTGSAVLDRRSAEVVRVEPGVTELETLALTCKVSV